MPVDQRPTVRLPLIEWRSGEPTPDSLSRLAEKVVSNDPQEAIDAFYTALQHNRLRACGVEEKEINGVVKKVWAYHTHGCGGNEAIIGTLRQSPLFWLFLERYDKGGHYYFTLLEGWQ